MTSNITTQICCALSTDFFFARAATHRMAIDSPAHATDNPDVLIYLSGAIEYSPDHGRAWRAAVTPLLQSLGHQVYDPSLDEKKNLSEEERAHFRAWKRTDLERFQQ